MGLLIDLGQNRTQESKMKLINLFKSWKSSLLIKRNKNLTIKKPFYIEFPERIKAQGNCYIGPYSYWSAKGNILLGKNIIFGPKTTIWSYNHNYKSREAIPYGGEDLLQQVTIEDNCWIGLGAIILPGVTLAEGTVIGAGSVVTKSTAPLSIIAGNPARLIGTRAGSEYEQLKKEEKTRLKT